MKRPKLRSINAIKKENRNNRKYRILLGDNDVDEFLRYAHLIKENKRELELTKYILELDSENIELASNLMILTEVV